MRVWPPVGNWIIPQTMTLTLITYGRLAENNRTRADTAITTIVLLALLSRQFKLSCTAQTIYTTTSKSCKINDLFKTGLDITVLK